MSKFVTKPREIEAIFYDGSNFAECQILCGFHKTTDGEDVNNLQPIGTYLPTHSVPRHAVAELWLQSSRTWTSIDENVWLIKDQFGWGWIVPETFSKHYVSVEDETVKTDTFTPSFITELTHLINKHSLESGSDTPDFILASFLENVLTDWNHALNARERWAGRR